MGSRTFGQALIKERIALDKAAADVLLDEIATIDHALSRLWTVTREYRRDPKAIWVETVCAEDNHQLTIGGEDYYIGADGDLLRPRRTSAPRFEILHLHAEIAVGSIE
jgi:hypothetical protein